MEHKTSHIFPFLSTDSKLPQFVSKCTPIVVNFISTDHVLICDASARTWIMERNIELIGHIEWQLRLATDKDKNCKENTEVENFISEERQVFASVDAMLIHIFTRLFEADIKDLEIREKFWNAKKKKNVENADHQLICCGQLRVVYSAILDTLEQYSLDRKKDSFTTAIAKLHHTHYEIEVNANNEG